MKKSLSIVALGIAILPSLSYADKANETVRTISNASETESNPLDLVADSAINLQEVTVSAHFVKANQTPLNLSTITPADIRLHQTAPNYLEMFQGLPGVYATASTGSYGDATLNMRGFKQDNISILLNGIPIQGLTSGSMYWNNWMGLADATYSVQIQKGLGASMLADCAMGGMVNIVTRTASELPVIDFGMSTTEYGTTKGTFGYSSGMLKNGWTVDLNLAYVKGAGYVEKTDIETFSYMLSVSKILNPFNTLIFTALGSPEKHDQRNTELTAAEVDKYGRDYSKNWGYYNGKQYSIGHNHYFKPYFTLQHLMDGERFSMKNSLYLAIADGGGSSTYNNYKSGVPAIINHQTSDGHIDFDAIVAENKSDSISKNVMIDYLSGHTQFGAIASGDYKITDSWKASAGLQYQYFDTWSKMTILDMLGGDVFIDPSTGASLTLGDYVGSRYGRTTHHISGFVQGRALTHLTRSTQTSVCLSSTETIAVIMMPTAKNLIGLTAWAQVSRAVFSGKPTTTTPSISMPATTLVFLMLVLTSLQAISPSLRTSPTRLTSWLKWDGALHGTAVVWNFLPISLLGETKPLP